MNSLVGMMLAGAAAVAGHGDGAGRGDAGVFGRWQTQTRHGVVEIAPCGGSICGRLVESDAIRADADARDTANRDPALRTRRLRGLSILQGFSAKDGAWTGGTIYNGEDGGTYSATVSLLDRDHLKVKGCIVWPLCKSQTWTRLR